MADKALGMIRLECMEAQHRDMAEARWEFPVWTTDTASTALDPKALSRGPVFEGASWQAGELAGIAG